MKILIRIRKGTWCRETTTETLLENKMPPSWGNMSIKEENACWRNTTQLAKEPPTTTTKTITKNDTTDPSYAGVADAIKPMNKIMRFYTKAATTPPSPIEVISVWIHRLNPKNTRSSAEFSPYKVLFFQGYHKRPSAKQRMFPSVGFPPHLARHLVFLTEDIPQVITFTPRNSLDLESISTSATCPTLTHSKVPHMKVTVNTLTNPIKKLPCAHETSPWQAGPASRIPSLKTYLLFLEEANWI